MTEEVITPKEHLGCNPENEYPGLQAMLQEVPWASVPSVRQLPADTNEESLPPVRAGKWIVVLGGKFAVQSFGTHVAVDVTVPLEHLGC